MYFARCQRNVLYTPYIHCGNLILSLSLYLPLSLPLFLSSLRDELEQNCDIYYTLAYTKTHPGQFVGLALLSEFTRKYRERKTGRERDK